MYQVFLGMVPLITCIFIYTILRKKNEEDKITLLGLVYTIRCVQTMPFCWDQLAAWQITRYDLSLVCCIWFVLTFPIFQNDVKLRTLIFSLPLKWTSPPLHLLRHVLLLFSRGNWMSCELSSYFYSMYTFFKKL